MKVIPPLEITDAMLTSSTIPDAVAATYNAGTTYADGDRAGAAIVYGASQAVWESLQNSNTGNAQTEGAWWTLVGYVYAPYDSGSSCDTGGIVADNTNHILYRSLVDANTGNALSDTSKWEEIGPTNRWAMFDTMRSTRTEGYNSFTVVVTPGVRCDSFAISGIIGGSYTLTVTSASYGGTIYSSTGTLSDRATSTWYEYFFGEFSYQNSLAFFDIPPYTDAVFTFTITGAVSLEVGALVVGMHVDLGTTLYTPLSDVLNFSTIARDADGIATLTQRRNVPKTRQQVICTKARVDRVRRLRDELNATPAFWCGIDDGSDGYYDALTILGIYKEFTIAMDLPEQATITLELEEI